EPLPRDPAQRHAGRVSRKPPVHPGPGPGRAVPVAVHLPRGAGAPVARAGDLPPGPGAPQTGRRPYGATRSGANPRLSREAVRVRSTLVESLGRVPSHVRDRPGPRARADAPHARG